MGEFMEYMFSTPALSVVATFLAITVLVVVTYLINELNELYDEEIKKSKNE